MTKTAVGPRVLLYPMPALLVGANVGGKPNFATVAWAGIVNSEPPMLSVSLRHNRHTLQGVRQNMVFSVNVPSADMVREVDFCGMTSGGKVDKVDVCKFSIFYGKLGSAPLIEQCPVNNECKVVHLLDLGTHMLVVGRIEETHVSAECLSDGRPDVDKIRPISYVTEPFREYRRLGDIVAKAYSAGSALKQG